MTPPLPPEWPTEWSEPKQVVFSDPGDWWWETRREDDKLTLFNDGTLGCTFGEENVCPVIVVSHLIALHLLSLSRSTTGGVNG